MGAILKMVMIVLGLSLASTSLADALTQADLDEYRNANFGVNGTTLTFFDIETGEYSQSTNNFNNAGHALIIDGVGTEFTDIAMSIEGHIGDGGKVTGSFEWYGASEALGIDEISLLATGSLVEVFHGLAFEDRQPGGEILGLFSTVLLDYINPKLPDIGPWMTWVNYWGFWAYDEEGFTSSIISPDGGPVEAGYTTTDMLFFESAFRPIPEPTSLALFCIGLLSLSLARASKNVWAVYGNRGG